MKYQNLFSYISFSIFIPSPKNSFFFFEVSVVSNSLQLHGLYSPWNSPDRNAGVGSLSLLQGIFPTQGSNPGLLHCRRNLYQLSHQGSLRILEWVAYPFSSGSPWARNWTGVSCVAGGFFTSWATRKTLSKRRISSFPGIKLFTPGDFPGCPVAKSPLSQCRGPRFNPWSGN